MELDDYLRSLRRGWWIVLSCAAIAVVLASTLARERPLRSTTRVVLGPSNELATDVSRLSTADTINVLVVNTLADVFVSQSVVVGAGRELGLDAAERGRYEVTATVGPESRVVDIAVEGPDRRTVRKLAGAIVEHGASSFIDLYRIYRVEVIETASAATEAGASRAAVTLVGVALGLAVGGALAITREWLAMRARGPTRSGERLTEPERIPLAGVDQPR